MPLTDAPLYKLYLGNRAFEPFSSDQEERILEIVQLRFPSFTMSAATGIFEGRRLPTLLIHIASHDRDAIVATCQTLGQELGQRWVGMSEGGAYTSIAVNRK